MAAITLEMQSDGSLIVPAALTERFAGVKALVVTPRDGFLVLTPQKRPAAAETLADLLPYLHSDDLLADAHRAKEESYRLFEDQGLATITLAVADALVQRLAESQVRPRSQVETSESSARAA
jgi:hypothetical protein